MITQILGFLQAVGGFLFIFGIVVLVHELGHFLAAKMTGVYAPRFSIGFGPGPSKRWGETEYHIGVIPLGGYVRMASREDEATAFLEGGSESEAEKKGQEEASRPRDWDPEAMIPFGPKPVPEHRWFESKTLPQRLVIMVAGVSMNAILAVVVLFGLNLFIGQTILNTREVARVAAAPEAAALQGAILPGDTILSVQGEEVENWNDIRLQLLTAPGDSLTIATSRSQVVFAAGRPGSRERQVIEAALEPYYPPVIAALSPGRPAERAGMLPGDTVISIQGTPVRTFSDLIEIVNRSAGESLDFVVVNNGVQRTLSITPEIVDVTDPVSGEVRQVGQIGAERAALNTITRSVGVPSAFVLSLQQTGAMTGSVLTTLKGLFTRQVSIRELGGPIMIAQESANAARRGLPDLLVLLALLSINLAILNLLPIPVLDGGQIVILLAESAKGSPFSPRARQFILGTGVALVLLLMLVVSYNDILRFFRN